VVIGRERWEELSFTRRSAMTRIDIAKTAMKRIVRLDLFYGDRR